MWQVLNSNIFQKNHFKRTGPFVHIFNSIRSMQHDLILQPDKDGIRTAGKMLRDGLLVAFPTETVYGLGANALNGDAARSIFVAKGRPTTDPLIVHILNAEDANPLIDVDGEAFEVFSLLGKSFWPGPLTLIVRAAACIPGIITANTGMVGIRSPSHPIAQLLLREAQVPVAAPSANLFGHVSPTRAEHVIKDLGNRGVHVINGDSEEYLSHTCVHGIESTVAKLDVEKKTVFVLRQGAITRKQVLDALQSNGFNDWTVEVVVRSVAMVGTHNAPAAEPSNEGELAPGQAITHYAPDIPCVIANSIEFVSDSPEIRDLTSSMGDKRLFNAEELRKTVVVDFGGKLSSIQDHVLAYKDISPDGNTATAARSLFLSLRWAEMVPSAEHVILANIIPQKGDLSAVDFFDSVGPGLADRMQRAASGVKINIKCVL